jgi:hypothetical protein
VGSAAQEKSLISEPSVAETAQSVNANQEKKGEREESVVTSLKAAVIFP